MFSLRNKKKISTFWLKKCAIIICREMQKDRNTWMHFLLSVVLYSYVMHCIVCCYMVFYQKNSEPTFNVQNFSLVLFVADDNLYKKMRLNKLWIIFHADDSHEIAISIAESFHSLQSLSVSCFHVILGLPGPCFPSTCMSKADCTIGAFHMSIPVESSLLQNEVQIPNAKPHK